MSISSLPPHHASRSSLHPVITGIGLCTALGTTAPQTWDALCAGRFITDHARAAGIAANDEPRVNSLARQVAREAIAQAKWSPADLLNAGLVVGTSKGPVDAWIASIASGPPTGGLDCAFGLAETAGVLAADCAMSGPRLTVSAACASGLVALIRGVMMIRQGEARRVLVVAAESSLHPLFIASFTRLGVIPPAGHGCRPFDQTRAGFVIGEAAAAICLEAPDASTGVRVLATIDQFSFGADASHLTHGDPTGSSLQTILHRVIDQRGVDLIHAHGTGTLLNDPIELAAIESCLPAADRPSLYSHKGALGHSLGASGLVAIALNSLCHANSMIPPNTRTSEPLPTTAIDLSPEMRPRPVRRSLAIAAGFGGALAAVTLL